MAGRRNNTPLFEIVGRQGSNAPQSDASSGARIEPKPAPAGDAPAATPRRPIRPAPAEVVRPRPIEPGSDAEPTPPLSPSREPDAGEVPRPAVPRTMGRISVGNGTVKLPTNYAYIALSIVCVSVLIAWTAGYVVGGRNAEEKARREIESATGGGPGDPTGSGIPRDPLDPNNSGSTGSNPATPNPAGNNPGTNPGGSQPRATPPRNNPAGTNNPPNATTPLRAGLPVVSAARTRFLAPGGFFASEPRTEDLNYFCLVSRLPEADAVRALEFLARNGVVAMGLERAGSDANNRSFDLFTLEGLTGSEYAGENGRERRTAHEALLAELGRRWRAEERGTSDFSRPQWYRYSP